MPDLAFLQALRREGVTDVVIARAAGLKIYDLVKLIGQRGKEKSAPDLERNAMMRRMRAAGLSDQLIADIVGLTKSGVHFALGPRPAPVKQAPAFFDPKAPHEWLKDFPKALRDFRTRNSLTQHNVAVMLGVARDGRTPSTMLSAWEIGKAACPLPVPVAYMLSDLEVKWINKSLTRTAI